MTKKAIAAAVMAVACVGMAQAKKPESKQEQVKKEQRQEAKTLGKQKPDPRPGEGFLIRGREGAVMDKGRPDTTTNWDLWRK